MKLISITPQEEQPSIIYIKPDTALLRNGDDFYLPEFSEKIEARLALIIKIKKVGKHISEKFSHRYYDDVSIGLNLEASDVLEMNMNAKLPWGNAVAFDYSAPIGQFIKKPESYLLSLNLNDEIFSSCEINKELIDKCIADTSQHFTLKIGDFIYITLPKNKLQLSIGQKINASLNETNLFKCLIK